jgi:hypothetical protein
MAEGFKFFGIEWYDIKTKFKKIIRSLFYTDFTQNLICLIFSGYIKLIYLTSKKRFINNDVMMRRFKDKQPIILASWHSRIMMSPIICTKAKEVNKTDKIAVLASKHGDGKFVGKIMEKFGAILISGSSRDGRKSSRGIDMHGLKNIFRALKNNLGIAITPDGPRGPDRKVGGGVIKIASMSGVPIMPIAFGYSKLIELKTWDKFRVPLPFGTIICYVGELLFIDKKTTEEQEKKLRLELGEKINFVASKADEIAAQT